MAKIYKSICCEIDRLHIKILDLSEEEIKYKLELEKLMNSGYVNIAKARYIMGSKSVSMLQLPTENSTQTTRALSRVHREEYKGYEMFKLQIIKPSSLSSDINEEEPTARKTKRKTIVTDKDNKDELLDSSDTVTNNEFSDPIKLFGVLVPFTLRTAQQFFKDSLFVIVKCATIQSELNQAISRYEHLSKMKFLVNKAAVDRGLKVFENTDYNQVPLEADSEDKSRLKKC